MILVGDAFAFRSRLSSGVFLALRSGEIAATQSTPALSDGDFSAGRFGEYGEQICRGVEAMAQAGLRLL